MMTKTRSEANYEQLRDRALHIISRRDHSVRELKQKLKQRMLFSEADFELVVEYLNKFNYLITPEKLAMLWIKEWRTQGKGRHWINGKLKTKGLAPMALSDDDEEKASALTFLARKTRSKSLKDASYKERAKIARSLVSRGFSSSLVATLIHDESL